MVVVATLAGSAILLVVLLSVPIGSSDAGPSGRVVSGHPLFGKLAPPLELEALDGSTVRISELRGRPVLLNFWATWCGPCREEFPLMVQAYEQYVAEDLEILGVIHDDGPDGARRFAAEQGATWPMLKDSDDVAWDDYKGAVMPTSFFIDAEGVVRAFSIGGFSDAGLASQLDKILPTASADDS